MKAEEAREKAKRFENAMEQNMEMQNLLRDELMKKSEEISYLKTTLEAEDRKMAYMKAEMSAIKTKLMQQDQAERSSTQTTEKLEAQVQQLEEQNQQLRSQVVTSVFLFQWNLFFSSPFCFLPCLPCDCLILDFFIESQGSFPLNSFDFPLVMCIHILFHFLLM